MAHEVESMFSVRKVPWHGLGKVLDYSPDSEAALIQAGLMWGVEKRQMFLGNGQRVQEHFATVRMTDDTILGVVGKDYKIIQNREAFSWTDSLLGEGCTYETAGSLRNGRRVWLCAKLPEPLKVVGDDVNMYLVFSNSHDGSSAVKVAVTPIRVVCQNTLTWGLKQAKRTWSLRHTSGLHGRLDEARKSLQLAQQFGDALIWDAERLAAKRMDFEQYLDQLMPLPKQAKDVTERMVKNVQAKREQIMDISQQADLRPFKGTAWGALQTMADYVSHGEPTRKTANFEENRFERLVDGDALLQQAYALASSM